MALPVSGAISFNNINVELAVTGTTEASLGQATYRALAGVASGAISMSDFYGKSSQFSFTISSNTADANLATLATAAGWNGSSALQATINSGVYVYSTSTGTPALTVSGSFPGGVSLINNGTIQGMGGSGGRGGIAGYAGTRPEKHGVAGSAGGLALSVSSAISITNNNRIAGGGGGGGGGGNATGGYNYSFYYMGGGAGGAGLGNGSFTSPGAGGSGTYINSTLYSGSGGSGGSYGASGGGGGNGNAYYDTTYYGYGAGGGAGGGAVSGNSNITWIATGTRDGGIS